MKGFRARAENTKTQFPGARGPGTGKKLLPHYPGWVSATLLGTTYLLAGPPPAGNSDVAVLWPILGPGRKTRKSNFPVLGTPLGGKSGRPKSFFSKFRNFSTCEIGQSRQEYSQTTSTPMARTGHAHKARHPSTFDLIVAPGTSCIPTIWGHIETEKRETHPLQLGPNTQS